LIVRGAIGAARLGTGAVRFAGGRDVAIAHWLSGGAGVDETIAVGAVAARGARAAELCHRALFGAGPGLVVLAKSAVANHFATLTGVTDAAVGCAVGAAGDWRGASGVAVRGLAVIAKWRPGRAGLRHAAQSLTVAIVADRAGELDDGASAIRGAFTQLRSLAERAPRIASLCLALGHVALLALRGAVDLGGQRQAVHRALLNGLAVSVTVRGARRT